MYRYDITRAVLAQRVVGIIRTSDAASAVAAAETMIGAGLRSLEVTLTNPRGLDAIERIGQRHPDVVLGAGTVLDEASAVLALRAGARFLVSPSLHHEVIRTAHRYGAAALPGTGSVTEIVQAMEAGADAVKLFPASSFTPRWLSDVRSALPQAPIVPTGGVTPDTVTSWLDAGAAACGIGAALTRDSADAAHARIATLLATTAAAVA
ncbi:MAG: bifunctional 4-hydroxy-2-oxoglutarate aldolase/2-dehydro-3-deoxy-phosphogluconate aldolase [Actinomycetia bacterium]|nr:bifunctional 4-hydroxy-2-oxoglutarate aldolase/2-dehydro-3-deoxy-phosphogluconate aldolase [Actinomycetes bacterium]